MNEQNNNGSRMSLSQALDLIKSREIKTVRLVTNKFDNRPMAMCKNYPDCDGSIIDLLEPEEYDFE